MEAFSWKGCVGHLGFLTWWLLFLFFLKLSYFVAKVFWKRFAERERGGMGEKRKKEEK